MIMVFILCADLSIHRIKRGDASEENYFREVQTLQMELQQIMKGKCAAR